MSDNGVTPKRSGGIGTAVITGASEGLGETYAHRLAKRGYDLLLIDRTARKLDEMAAALRATYGVEVKVLGADLSNPGDLVRVSSEIEHDSRIALLVNNAGVSKLALVSDTIHGQREAMMGVNVKALTVLSHVTLKKFKERNQGTLINVGSVPEALTLPMSGISSGAKAYVMNFTFSLQSEVENTNIFVQLVMPASTATPIWENSGLPFSLSTPDSITRPEQCVDDALAGLDRRENVTWASAEDKDLFDKLRVSAQALCGAPKTGAPASRYGLLRRPPAYLGSACRRRSIERPLRGV